MKKALFFLSIYFLLFGCGKDNSAPAKSQKPTAAKLIFPFENFLCNVGTDITPTESTILFEWEKGENNDKYELILKNLTTGAFTSYPTTNTEIPIVLERLTPFKWYVISKSNFVIDTTHSATWKFFNAGAAVASYAPFPAEILSPAMAAKITTTASVITLDWTGSDVDNDIVGYDVYFGTTDSPSMIETDLKESILNNVSIQRNTIYYWKIITKDASGNKSDSGVYQFKIL